MKQVFLSMVIIFGLAGCSAGSGEKTPISKTDPDDFGNAWYQGKAEIARFELEQSRYGAMHSGDAVQIFVTEPFLAEEQVKHEFGDGEAYTVLKLNFTKSFLTGIYPYTLMTSTFSRIDFENPEIAKVSFSAQEWCGHQFVQLNRRGEGFDMLSRSYFQKEGDQERRLPNTILEDEIWTMIRMTPDKLPLGEFEIIPSMEHVRLRHQEPAAMRARAELKKDRVKKFSKEDVYRYQIEYEGGDRVLTIFFGIDAPHEIFGWQEKIGQSTTTAVRTHVIWNDYWSRNQPGDRELRKELGLSR